MEEEYLISRSGFTKLANTHDQHCVSIYIPTYRAGHDADIKKGQITLKNCLKEVRAKLKHYQLGDHEIEDYLEPAENLLTDYNFWKNQSDCLAIFISNSLVKIYTLPVEQPEFTYVADHFYLLPIFPVLTYEHKFYLLNLSLNKVKFYESTRYSITEINLEGIVPEKLEEVVGYNYQSKSLQFRTGQGGDAGVIYHGQGSGKEDKEMETEKFLRAVDQSLMSIIKEDDSPLVLACVDHYFPMYKKITSYSNVYARHVKGNHEDTPPKMLHEMALEEVNDFFYKNRKNAAKRLNEQSSVGKISFDLNDIIPAAIDGRIESLFIQKLKDRFGLYDKINRSLIIDEGQKAKQASLFNLAAVQTWLKDGDVFIVEKEEMPIEGTNINALFRY